MMEGKHLERRRLMTRERGREVELPQSNGSEDKMEMQID
jgi:hypothetical protein